MVDELQDKPINFSIEDVGSDILTRFIDDMYTSESIIRELVKNATDSYYQLEDHCHNNGIPFPSDYDSDNRRVDITIEGDKIFIIDKGIGCDSEDIRKLIKIAISDKPEISGATGFRGIGFWSAFSAGEKITVESTKYGSEERCVLEINTQNIRNRIAANKNLSEIMNDPTNISLKVGEAVEKEHYSIVEVECEGRPREEVGEKENRLYDTIHNDTDSQEEFIKKTCALHFPEVPIWLKEEMEIFYAHSALPVFKVYLNGNLLTKSFNENVEAFREKALTIEIDDGTGLKPTEVAKCWYVRKKAKSGIIPSGMKGVRLYKDAYPIGGANIFSDNRPGYPEIKAGNKLDYYIAEVHITCPFGKHEQAKKILGEVARPEPGVP